MNLLIFYTTDTPIENGIENSKTHYMLHLALFSQFTLCDINIQEAKQKQEVERQLDLERKQAEDSSDELKRKLEELKKQLQERDAQVKPLRSSS